MELSQSDPSTNTIPKKHGVVAILRDDHGRYLVIQRGLTLKRAPGWWCFPGGEVEPGESLEAAITREMQEELGLPIIPAGRVHQSISPNNEYLLHWYRANATASFDTLKPHPIEVAEVRWLTANEILALPSVLPGLVTWLRSGGLK